MELSQNKLDKRGFLYKSGHKYYRDETPIDKARRIQFIK